MKLSQKEIAESFSNGNFEMAFPYLSENIIWNVVGVNLFNGKAEVVENCKQTSKYFKSIETDFKTEDVIVAEHKVIIRGTGEFIRDGKRLNLITACDVYEFNRNGELEKIYSYCISENK